MYIGHNLRREREIKGWSQEALGMAIGLSQGTVSLHESNHHEVGWEQIQNYAKALSITPEALYQPQNGAIIHIESQQGTHVNTGHNYISSNDTEVKILHEHIQSLKEENAFLRKLVESKFSIEK